MAAMKRAHRTVDSQVQIDVPAHAENRLLSAGRMGGSVDDYPAVGSQRIAVLRQYRGKVRRTGFLLAFEEYLEVEAGGLTLRLQRIDGGQDRHHAELVVGGGAGIDPPIGIDPLIACRQRQYLSVLVHTARSEDGRKRSAGLPILRRHRLAVIMGIDDKGAFRSRDAPLSVDCRRDGRAVALQQTRRQAPFRHHGHNMLGVEPDIRQVARYVRNCEQLHIFGEDRALVPVHPIRRLCSNRWRRKQRAAYDECHFHADPPPVSNQPRSRRGKPQHSSEVGRQRSRLP